MIDPEREELLSAYLDGEVSPEERVRVERWLAESSELRQMRDELLSMRTDLQALPRRQVGHDLAAVVMHRSTAASNPDPSTRSAPTTSSVTTKESPLGRIVVEWWNRGSQGRRFLWPALAVAAALAILVFDARQRPNEFEVAQAPKFDSPSAELREESTVEGRAPAEQPSIRGMPEMSASQAVPSTAAPSTAASTATRGGNPTEPPMPRSAEVGPPSERVQDSYAKLRESAPADSAPRERSLKKSPASAEMFARQAEQAALSLAVETIICPVTPQYLEERKFEKLLDANQVRWQQVPIPPQLQVQATPQSPRTAPLESLGKSPLQSLYFLQAESAQVNSILSQVPQADKLMEGNRLATVKPQQPLKAGASSGQSGVQVMLVAPVDIAAPKAEVAPASKPAP